MSSEASSPSNPAKPAPPTESAWSVPTVVHWILFVGLIALFGVSLAHREYAERMFIHATYYFLLVLVVAWIGTYPRDHENKQEVVGGVDEHSLRVLAVGE